jgi:hypothetical protein
MGKIKSLYTHKQQKYEKKAEKHCFKELTARSRDLRSLSRAFLTA